MKKWYKLLDREGFGTIINENGYQVTYKGYRIGGAGIDPQGQHHVAFHYKFKSRMKQINKLSLLLLSAASFTFTVFSLE